MNTEQERAEFEAWYRLHHGIRDVYGRDSSGEYTDKQVQGAFNVWQARAALIDLADDIRAALAAQPAASADQVQALLEERDALLAERDRLKEALTAMLEIHGVTQRYADAHIEIPQSWVDVSDLARAALAQEQENKA